MMKKIFVCMLFALCMVVGVSMTGCGNGTDGPQTPPPEVRVTLNETNVALDLFEKFALSATVENTTESVVWSSSDTDVVRVVGGNLTAISTGNATVTASVGEKSAECAVTVADSGTACVIDAEESVIIGKGDMLTVSAEVWRGNKYKIDDEFVTYAWQLAQEAAADVAETASETNKPSIKFRGLNVGATKYVLSAVVGGATVARNIDITVRNTQVRFDFTEVNGEAEATYFKGDPSTGVWKARIAMKTVGETHKNTVATGFAVTDGETPKAFSDVTISYKDGDAEAFAANSEIVAFSEGTLTALKEGSTVVKGVYDGVEMEFAVETYRPRVEIDNAEPIELEREASDMASGKAITFSFTETVKPTDETVVSLKLVKNAFISGNLLKTDGDTTLSGTDLTVTVVNGNMPYAAANLGETELVLATDKADYAFDAFVYTKAIGSVAELNDFGPMAHAMAEKAEGLQGAVTGTTTTGTSNNLTVHGKNSNCTARGLWDGYYVLKNDITFTADETYKPFINYHILENGTYASGDEVQSGSIFFQFADGNENQNAWRESQYGFRGVFDGRGYTIANMKLIGNTTNKGFITLLHREGTIKNLAFTDAVIGDGSSFLTATGAGTIENVYVQAASQGKGVTDGGVMRYSGFAYGSADTNDMANNVPTLKNVFFVSNVASSVTDATAIGGGVFGKNMFNGVVSVSSAADAFGTAVSGVDKDNVGYNVYNTFGALKNAELDFSTWEGDFWALKNGLPYPKKFAANPGVQDADLLETHPNDEATVGDTLTYKLKNAASTVSVSGGTANFTSAVDFTVTPAQTDNVKQNVTVTVTNAYDPTKMQTHTVIVTMKLEMVKAVADSTQRNNSDTIDVDLSDTAANGFYVNLDGRITDGNVTVKSVALGNKDVDLQYIRYVSGKLNVQKAAYTGDNALYGEQKFTATLETDSTVYVVEADIIFADVIIDSEEDFRVTRLSGDYNQHDYSGKLLRKHPDYNETVTGYIILKNDITCIKYDTQQEDRSYGIAGQYSDGVNPMNMKSCFIDGVFDGRNHVIKNAKVGGSNGGLFTSIYRTTIKNVTFINAELATVAGRAASTGFLATSCGNSTIENVTVYAKIGDGLNTDGNNPGCMLISKISHDLPTTVKNCLVVVESQPNKQNNASMLVSRMDGNAQKYVTIKNCICVNMANVDSANLVRAIYNEESYTQMSKKENVHTFLGWNADRTNVDVDAFTDSNIVFIGESNLPVSKSVMTDAYKDDLAKYYPQGTDFTTESDA